jgi:TolB-like protein/tetratricopeptide (TPR) repeat protein
MSPEVGTRAPRSPLWLLFVPALVLIVIFIPGRNVLASGTIPRFNSLAVLPLENLSGDPEQAYLADGIHDALIAGLGQISSLKRVLARDSVLRFRGANQSPGAISKELNVAGLVTGAVLKSGDRLKVTVRLVDPKTGGEVWAGTFERPLRDVLSLENEIVTAITREAKLRLTPEEKARLSRARPVNPESHDEYLKGMHQLYRNTPAAFAAGTAALRHAAALDPADPLPYVGLALAYPVIYHVLSGTGFVPYKEGFPPARAAALKALELDERSADAHMALAVIKTYFDWDWPGAEREFRRALALNPSLSEAHFHYGWYLHIFGRNEEAMAELKRTAELDPRTPNKMANVGWLCWNLGKLDEAMAWARKALDLDSNDVSGLFVTSGVYADRKMFDEAIATDRKLAAVDPDWKFSLAGSYILAGRKDEALKIVAEMERKDYPRFSNWLFMLRTMLGDKEEAFRALDAAFEYHQILLPWTMALGDASFPWRTDPRWQAYLRRMNFPRK